MKFYFKFNVDLGIREAGSAFVIFRLLLKEVIKHLSILRGDFIFLSFTVINPVAKLLQNMSEKTRR